MNDELSKYKLGEETRDGVFCIKYSVPLKGNKPLIHWVRTNLEVIAPDILSRIGYVEFYLKKEIENE